MSEENKVVAFQKDKIRVLKQAAESKFAVELKRAFIVISAQTVAYLFSQLGRTIAHVIEENTRKVD